MVHEMLGGDDGGDYMLLDIGGGYGIFAEEYRRRAAALVAAAGWEPVDPMRRDFRGATALERQFDTHRSESRRHKFPHRTLLPSREHIIARFVGPQRT